MGKETENLEICGDNVFKDDCLLVSKLFFILFENGLSQIPTFGKLPNLIT